jgi:hypothetical protein
MSNRRRAGVPSASEQRIQEALAIPGLAYFVIACPKDVPMYRDAVRSRAGRGVSGSRRLQVKELIEPVEEAVGDPSDGEPARRPSLPAGSARAKPALGRERDRKGSKRSAFLEREGIQCGGVP